MVIFDEVGASARRAVWERRTRVVGGTWGVVLDAREAFFMVTVRATPASKVKGWLFGWCGCMSEREREKH